MIKKIDMSDSLKTVKAFILGISLTLLVFSVIWMKNHYKAIVMAVSYPEVVESLKVEKTFTVKK